MTVIYPFVILWRTFPSLPSFHVGSKLMYIPLALTEAETTRDAFLQGFFSYYLLNYNWKFSSNITCENYLQSNQERCTILCLSIYNWIVVM